MQIKYDKSSNELSINKWKITNKDVLDSVADLESESDIEVYISRCLAIGSVALKSAKLSERIDYIQKNFNSLQQSFDERISEYSKELSKELEKYTKDVKKELESRMKEFTAFIDGKDGVKVCLNNYFGEKGEIMEILSAFIDSSLSLEESDSPMRKIRDEFLKKVNDLAKQLEGYTKEKEKEHELKEKSPLKGKDYENDVEYALNDIAQVFGDEVLRVGAQGGVGGGKKGDFNVRVSQGLPAPQIMTFEAKAGSQNWGGNNGIISILDNALVEREAEVAVGVLRDLELLPKTYRPRNGVFREYGNDKIVCVANTDNWFPLRVAYKVARARLLLSTEKGMEVDAPALNEKLDSIIEKLQRFSKIKGRLTSVTGTIDEVKSDVSKLQEEIVDDLKSIQNELE